MFQALFQTSVGYNEHETSIGRFSLVHKGFTASIEVTS